MHQHEDAWSRTPAIVIGLLLIAVGVAFLAMQWFGWELPIDLGRVGWPLFIIAPGAVLLLVGLFLPQAPGLGLAIAGGIVTTVGLILAYQSVSGHWASWAYAWSLIAPTSIGAAMVVWSALHGGGDTFRGGLAALATGLVIFLIGFAFFEGVLNIGGERGLATLGRQALPFALIVVGVLVIASRLWPRSQRPPVGPWQDQPSIAPPPSVVEPGPPWSDTGLAESPVEPSSSEQPSADRPAEYPPAPPPAYPPAP